jgi:hypothetical protein
MENWSEYGEPCDATFQELSKRRDIFLFASALYPAPSLAKSAAHSMRGAATMTTIDPVSQRLPARQLPNARQTCLESRVARQ